MYSAGSALLHQPNWNCFCPIVGSKTIRKPGSRNVSKNRTPPLPANASDVPGDGLPFPVASESPRFYRPHSIRPVRPAALDLPLDDGLVTATLTCARCNGHAVSADQGVAGVQAGHEAAPRRGADRAAGVAVGEADSLGGHLVEAGRLDELLPLAAQIAVAEVIGQEKDDIGTTRRPCLTARGEEKRGRKSCCGASRSQPSQKISSFQF